MLPDRPGLDVLPSIRQRDPHLPVVVITAYSSIESAIEAMRGGAFHYVPKPFKNEEVLHLVRRAVESRRLQFENIRLRNRLQGMEELVGTSRPMREVLEVVQRAAPARSNILVVGESGTGKELVARAVHRLSPRKGGPFVPVHTSAIPSELVESTLFGHVKGAFAGAVASRKGLIESADGGTLFLDEVESISPDTQAKLLRVIQERELRRVGGVEPLAVDVRLIAASGVDLWQLVQEGQFREDLYYRLGVIIVELPPLRERPEDIPPLAHHFLRLYAAENARRVEGFTPQAMDALTAYHWPGNVRELQNAIERAVVLCRSVVISHELLPAGMRGAAGDSGGRPDLPADGLSLRDAVSDFKRSLIQEALDRCDGVQRQAAKLLQLSPTTLNEMIRRLGLQ